MNYAALKPFDVANGPGIRVSLFVSGCRHMCKNCFNKEAWDFNYGEPYTEAETEKIIEAMKPDYIKGFSLLGGEPFEKENQAVLCEVLEKIRKAYPEKTIWCYTGFSYDTDLLTGKICDFSITKRMLDCIDILVDGKFIEEEKDLSLRFKGSRNQRIIDVQASLKEGKIIRWSEDRIDD
jgi:anaerobic ribonucleoside-triphosphate reductase activating protein